MTELENQILMTKLSYSSGSLTLNKKTQIKISINIFVYKLIKNKYNLAHNRSQTNLSKTTIHKKIQPIKLVIRVKYEGTF